MSLPTDDKARKALPIWDGVIMYFPDVWAEIAKVSKAGNDQHNPGEPLHWARGKSMDQMNTALRHMIDHGTGTLVDTDGGYHLAKAIWRLCAELQLTLEQSSIYTMREVAKGASTDGLRIAPAQGAEEPCDCGLRDEPTQGAETLGVLGRDYVISELTRTAQEAETKARERHEAKQRYERELAAGNPYRHF